MPVLFLAFANSDRQRLDTLLREDTEVNKILNERVARGDFQIQRQQFATREGIISTLRQFQNDLCLFLYSGHAGRDLLELEDGNANAEGIAALLTRCPNLKLVLLNGCSTGGQVAGLLGRGIPVVIATSAPVGDEKAVQFSIRFFTELAKNGASIRQAFAVATDAAKVFGTIHAETTARGAFELEKTDEPLWGLYFQDKDADLLDTWRLPEKPGDTRSNQYLEAAIAGIFEMHEAQLRTQGEEARGQDAILKRLPYTISEPIRKLLAPHDASGAKFYDQPGEDRYRMMLHAYRALMNFVSFTLLGQWWQEQSGAEKPGNAEALAESIRQRLVADFREDEKRSNLPLLRQLAKALKDSGRRFFLTELEEALAQLDGDPDTRQALDFLEKQVAASQPLAQQNIERLCDETEQHLAVVLWVFGFLVHYSLTSIKDISVLFYQHSTDPDFEHKVVKLQQSLTHLEERSRSEKTYFRTAAVLLENQNDKSSRLYLSPFLIDENAYTKTPKANLRSFVAYDAANRYFHFRHVSKPEDMLRIEKKRVNILAKIKGEAGGQDDYFPLINGQFSAFCQAVLGKPIENL